MKDLVADVSVDLLAPIPHGSGQTVLREALLVADHNAYHLAQVRQLSAGEAGFYGVEGPGSSLHFVSIGELPGQVQAESVQ